MATLELKDKAIDHLRAVEDDSLLKELIWLMDSRNDLNVVEIPENHLEGINEGLEDIKAGRVISNNDLKKQFEKWN